MVLAKQNTDLPLNGGLNVKQAAELQSPASLVAADNVRFNKLGQLEKRAAYTSQATHPTSTNNDDLHIEAILGNRKTALALSQHQGILPVSISGVLQKENQLNPYWDAPRPKACRVSRRFVAGASQSLLDRGFLGTSCATAQSGLLVVAWLTLASDTQVTMYARAYDANGSVVAEYSEFNSVNPSYVPTVQACALTSGDVVITWGVGSVQPFSIKALTFANSTSTFGSSATIVSGDSYYLSHAICRARTSPANNDEFYIAYTRNATIHMRVYRMNASATISATHDASHSGIYSSVCDDGTNGALIVSSDAGLNAWAEKFGSPGTPVSLAAAGDVVVAVSACAQSYYVNGSNAYAAVGVSLQNTVTGTVAGPSPLARYTKFYQLRYDTVTPSGVQLGQPVCGAFLASHGVAYEGQPYFAMALDNVYRSTNSFSISSALLVRVDCSSSVLQPSPVARICHDRLSYIAQLTCSPNLTVSSSGVIQFPFMADPSPSNVSPFNAKVPQSLFVSNVQFPNGSALPVSNLEVNGVTMAASGALFEFDGHHTIEAQPYHPPRVLVETSHAGGTTTADTFNIIAIYRFVDDAGRLHRSAPSLPVTVPAVSAKRIDAYVSMPPCPAHCGLSAPVGMPYMDVELYATAVGGSTYFLLLNGLGQKLEYGAPPTAPWFLFSGIAAGIPGGVALYSSGASNEELVSEPPPSLISIARICDRVWGVDAEDRSRIWFSKPLVAGYGVEWNAACTLNIGDNAVGIADVNGLPTIFGERGIWTVSGQGPNALGVGDFDVAQRLPHEVSAVCPTSICKTSAGIVFRSNRGISMLGIGLDLQPLGLPIDPLTPLTSGSAQIIKCLYDERHNEVRVVDQVNGLFVFNTVEQKWTRFLQDGANQQAMDTCLVDGRVWYLHKPNSGAWSIRRELGVDEASYNVSAESARITTPWIELNSVNGFGKVYRATTAMRLPATNPAGHAFTVTMFADYDSTTVVGTYVYSDASALGVSAGQVLLSVVEPSTQKLGALKLDIQWTSTNDAGSTPISLRLDYGVRPTGKRQVDTRALKG